MKHALFIFCVGVCSVAARAQSTTPPARLSLAQAEELAIRNHPRLSSAALSADAGRAVVTQVKSALYPTVTGSFTAAAAEHGSTIAAGMLQTSSLYSRVAAGVSITELVTDFGRTGNLVEAAKLRGQALNQNVSTLRAAIRGEVEQAYFQALASETVLRVARAVVENRRLTLRQVTALTSSLLKSTLDQSFAEVAVSEAELAVVRAENDAQATRARLAVALGTQQAQIAELEDQPLPEPLEPNIDALLAQASKQRPDLAALRLNRDAAERFARAERALNRPTVALMGTAGALPATDPRLKGIYSSAGVNVTVPIFNGKLNSARQSEAEFRAAAAGKDLDDLSVQVAGQVRVAWLEANTAFRRLDVTARLVVQAGQALRLAQIRYDTGLGSIVELNQAQLSQMSAEIAAANAKYDYLSRRAALSFVMGAL